MRLTLLGLGLLAAGAAAVVFGILPWPDAVALGERVWPVLLFAVAATVVAELASEAGLFSVVAGFLARLSLGRAWVLWLLVAALSTVATAFLSLDTTAVLLTPVVVLLARRTGVPALPFALTTVWLANTASLWLPVSNLTNLLASTRFDGGAAGHLALLWLPALVATVVPCVLLAIRFRRELAGPVTPRPEGLPPDRVLLWIAGVVVAVLLPLLVIALEPWMPATAAAVALVIAFLVRRPRTVRLRLVPLPLVVFASGLFLAVAAAHALGATAPLLALVGEGEDVVALLRMSLGGALSANAIDNLPAYLALEPAADTPRRLAALLIGVNAGPLITPWASLATLLWHQRLRALDVELDWWRYARLGLVAAPLTVVAATVALALG